MKVQRVGKDVGLEVDVSGKALNIRKLFTDVLPLCKIAPLNLQKEYIVNALTRSCQPNNRQTRSNFHSCCFRVIQQ